MVSFIVQIGLPNQNFTHACVKARKEKAQGIPKESGYSNCLAVREFSVLLPVGSAGIRYAVLESLFKEWFPLFTVKEVKSLCL